MKRHLSRTMIERRKSWPIAAVSLIQAAEFSRQAAKRQPEKVEFHRYQMRACALAAVYWLRRKHDDILQTEFAFTRKAVV